jgi:oligopeptide transport system ATP-binding protein
MICVENLTKRFTGGLFRKHSLTAVEDVSFEIARGETLGLCGESGCGKSTLGRLIVRLLEPTSGRILFKGKDLAAVNGHGREFRRRMQIIFQDSDGALDPRMKIRDLLLEPLKVHGLKSGRSRETITQLMDLVKLTPELIDRYPHELSGGQRQRISIARAVCLNPEFLVADEPTASLDLLVQTQMLKLLRKIQVERGIGCLFISHNLNSVRRMADRVAVMYLGQLVEIGRTRDIFDQSAHPYTKALLASAPHAPQGRRMLLQGDLFNLPRPDEGCRFHPRCPQARAVCAKTAPPLENYQPGHQVRCLFISA